MSTSNLEYLQDINTIVLCAGHGEQAGEPGAVDFDSTEAKDTVRMTDRIAANLKKKGLSIVVVPHALGLVGGINWVNQRYANWNDCWNIEIHRDSAGVAHNDETSKRCGCYYAANYPQNKAIADLIRDIMKRDGASSNTWSRPDNVHYPGGLGWIQQTNGIASLIELGFIQGNSSSSHLDWLADLASKAIYEAFTGKKYSTPTVPTPPPPPVASKITVSWTKDNLYRVFDSKGTQLIAKANNPVDEINDLNTRLQEAQDDLKATDKVIELQAKEIADLKSQLVECEATHGINLPNDTDKDTNKKVNAIWAFIKKIFKVQ